MRISPKGFIRSLLLHFIKIIVNFEICREVFLPKGRSAACFLVI